MARRRPLYVTNAAQRFREIIRPSLVGNLGRLEPTMAGLMAEELFAWLYGVVSQAVQTTKIKDGKGELSRQLHEGVTVIGRSSMRIMTGRIDAYPWVFPHEFGGDIHPTSGPYLAVPIFYGLRADGSAKYRSALAWKRWGSFVYTRKSDGKKFLAYKAANGDLRILYVLVEKTTIPARLGLTRLADAEIGALINAWAAIWVEMLQENMLVPLFESPPL